MSSSISATHVSAWCEAQPSATIPRDSHRELFSDRCVVVGPVADKNHVACAHRGSVRTEMRVRGRGRQRLSERSEGGVKLAGGQVASECEIERDTSSGALPGSDELAILLHEDAVSLVRAWTKIC